jgi:hypothetical protein
MLIPFWFTRKLTAFPFRFFQLLLKLKNGWVESSFLAEY